MTESRRGHIPKHVVDEVRDRTDLAQLIGDSIKLKRRGRSWVACCPFHNEKTPSFFVTPSRGMYHCYGCHQGGDAISWAMDYMGFDFKDAIGMLADRVGIHIDGSREGEWSWQPYIPPPAPPPKPILKWPESSISRFANKYAHYLRDRGVTMGAAVAFGLGWDEQNMRATFPIRQADGQLVGITGRTSQPRRQPKYLHYRIDTKEMLAVASIPRELLDRMDENDLEDRFMTWPRNRLLFGLQSIAIEPPCGWRDGNLYLVEGHLDAVISWQRGCRTVATMGTYVSDGQAQMLVEATPERGRLVEMFDPDRGGLKARDELAGIIYGRVPLWRLSLPPVRVPPGKVLANMTDEELDECEPIDPGNATDEEFDTAYERMQPAPKHQPTEDGRDRDHGVGPRERPGKQMNLGDSPHQDPTRKS